jgi:hypothetical protein
VTYDGRAGAPGPRGWPWPTSRCWGRARRRRRRAGIAGGLPRVLATLRGHREPGGGAHGAAAAARRCACCLVRGLKRRSRGPSVTRLVRPARGQGTVAGADSPTNMRLPVPRLPPARVCADGAAARERERCLQGQPATRWSRASRRRSSASAT